MCPVATLRCVERITWQQSSTLKGLLVRLFLRLIYFNAGLYIPHRSANICTINLCNQLGALVHCNIGKHLLQCRFIYIPHRSAVGTSVQSTLNISTINVGTLNIGILEHWNIGTCAINLVMDALHILAHFCKCVHLHLSPLKSWSFACRITIPHFAFHPNVYMAH